MNLGADGARHAAGAPFEQDDHAAGAPFERAGRYAGAPFDDDEATIAAYLEDLSVPALMMSMVHMTGDPAVLRGEHKPVGIYLNEVQGFMAPEAQAAVRAQALEVILAWRDTGYPATLAPDDALLAEMMQVLLSEAVPEEYLGLIGEELELDGVDPRAVPWPDDVAPERAGDFHVVVIGAGMSGLLAAIRLGQAGVPYTVIEKNAGVGGTWYENRYPGARVDVGNHFYSYSFAPDDHWSEYFAQQPELQAYFEHCLARYGVADHVRFATEVRQASWDDDTATWTVEVAPSSAAREVAPSSAAREVAPSSAAREVAPSSAAAHEAEPAGDATGPTETVRANALISAVGQLNRPRLPDIEGRDDFAGLAMHTAQWVDGTDLAGRRVAVIGTGASAFQLVPTIAPDAEHVTVFQRSAPWMFPNPNYHAPVGPGVAWAVRHLPYYGRWYRFLLFWPACDGGLAAMRVDPDYPHPDVAISEINDAARQVFTQWMADQVGDDAELLAKVVPDYVCLGKRTLQDNGSWLGALTRDDVDLVTEPIERIVADGVVTRAPDGTEHHHPVDVIVYATGFHANRFLWPMDVVGRHGRVLAEQWGDRPTAHLGITAPNFPNLFCLYGPGTNLASGGSIIFHVECQVRYVMGALVSLIAGGHHALEVRQDVHDAYNVRLQAELDTMVWSHPSIANSWYRGPDGRIYGLSPWRLVDYWSWTRTPDPTEFTWT